MKQYKYIVIVAVALLSSCTKENDWNIDDNTSRTALTVQVSDDGYVATVGEESRTRAVENGYKTAFTAGDKIGLFVGKGTTLVANNVPLTYNGTSWEGTVFYEGSDAKYFAYYPYQDDMSGKIGFPAQDAAAFFDRLVRGWIPTTDQSTHAKYTAQDLMIGSGTVSGSSSAPSLSLTLTHKMVLAVIKTPITKYTLSTDLNYTWFASATDLTFNGFAPLVMETGVYRYLVKPAVSTQYSGSYTNATGNTQEFLFSPNTTAGICKIFTVDGATVIDKNYTMQVGDFYMKDGSLVDKDATLTDAQKAACLGVVFWVGDPTNDTDGDPLLKKDKPGCTHGLAMALHDASTSNSLWSSSDEDITSNWLSGQSTTYGITTLKESNKMQGYANTKALEGYNASDRVVPDNLGRKVLPVGIIAEYAKSHSTPANSSGWFWPSVKELAYMCHGQNGNGGVAGRDMLNKQLSKVPGAASLQSYLYWSSTEYDYDWAWFVYFDDGDVNYDGNKRFESLGVRAVVAF